MNNIGVAAFNISGCTLHQAFSLPFNQFNGNMPRLKEGKSNTLMVDYNDVQLVIIDEVSMMSLEQLFQVDERLKQIFKTKLNFGGK